MVLPANLATGDLIDEPWVDNVVNELTALPSRYVAVPTAWTALTLGANWLVGSLMYRKVGDEVQLRGNITTSVNQAANAVLGTLPAGFRPAVATIQLAAWFSGVVNFTWANISTAGVITVSGAILTGQNLVVDQVRFSTVA